MLDKLWLKCLIEEALKEDIGFGDVTTSAILKGDEIGQAKAIAKQNIIVAGIDVFKEVFSFYDQTISFAGSATDGKLVKKGESLAIVSGFLRSILITERVALNLFQRMCGIATLTKRYVDEVKDTNVRLLDTRKTTPCLRGLEKYAVRVGGGYNHRLSLSGGVLIKDNHICAAGGILEAVKRINGAVPSTLKIEIEVKNLKEVEDALSAGVDIIMLDNMGIEEMREAVLLVGGRSLVEASGNITLQNVREVADTGVDFISVGALTHSVTAADISLNIISH